MVRTRWRVGGAAVALTAASTGAMMAPPAQAGTLAATSISIRTLKASVHPGGTDTITGDLAVAGRSAAGRVVSLEAHTPGTPGYTPVGEVTSRTNGGISFAVTPDVTTLYRWHYDGSTDARSSTSGVVRVAVTETRHHAHRLGTTLSIRATKRAISRTGVATVRGRLRSGRTGLPHRQVYLLAHRPGQNGWHLARSGRTAARGGYRFWVTPRQTTSYRVLYLGSQVFRPSHSGTVRVHVRQRFATSLSVRGRDAAHRQFAVSGVLRGGGHALRHARVTLWSRAPHSTTWAAVARRRTGQRGGVHFTRPDADGTAYRLRFGGNRRYAPSVSGTVVN